jgi:hypothetical protein
LKKFLDSIRYEEPLFVGGKKFFFSLKSFRESDAFLMKIILDNGHIVEPQQDRSQRSAQIDREIFGIMLSKAREMAIETGGRKFSDDEDDLPVLPSLFIGSLETPLRYSPTSAQIRFCLEYIEPPGTKILIRPKVVAEKQVLDLGDITLFECAETGMIHKDTYYRFGSLIKRCHLLNLPEIAEMTIPEPLFGTFVENALPELKRFAEVTNTHFLEKFVTLPYAGKLGARCALSYLDGELEATLYFSYEGREISSIASKLSFDDIKSFVTQDGVVARNLVEGFCL